MNPNTGEVFRDINAKLAAELRGEPLVDVSEDVADAVEIGMDKLYAVNRHERRKLLSEARRNAKKRARQ